MANLDQEKINFILKSLKSIDYGSLVITIHDSKIIQVDTTVKNRFINRIQPASK